MALSKKNRAVSTRVLVFGTFDVLHPGHVRFLREASTYGPVTVALTPDKLCQRYKGHRPVNPYATRAERLSRLRYVAVVVPADEASGTFAVVGATRPTTVVLGYDQLELGKLLAERLAYLLSRPHLVTLPAYRSSTYQSSRLLRSA